MFTQKNSRKWIVLFGVFIAYFIADGWSYSFGIFYPEMLVYFEESHGVTAIIPALLYGIPMLFSPFICIILQIVGCRFMGVFGGIALSISLVMSSFSNSFIIVCIIMGSLSALGLAAIYVAAIVSVTFHFNVNERGLATGLALAGSGIGSIVFPHLIEYIIFQFSWRPTLFLVGAILLNASVAGTTYFTPNKQLDKIKKNKNQETITIVDLEFEIINLNKTNNDKNGPIETTKEILYLFKSIQFILFAISNFLLYSCMSIPFTYVCDLALNLDYDVYYGTFLLSLIALSRIIGQIVVGLLNDKCKVNSYLLFGLLIVIESIAIGIIPFCGHYVTLCLCFAVFGVCISVTYVFPLICLIELFGERKSVLAFGVIQFIQGIATIIGTPLGGFLFDLTNSYNMSFYISGCVMGASGVLICFVYKINKHTESVRT